MLRGESRVIGNLRVRFTLPTSEHEARVQIEVHIPQVKCFKIPSQANAVLNMFHSSALYGWLGKAARPLKQ